MMQEIQISKLEPPAQSHPEQTPSRQQKRPEKPGKAPARKPRRP
nr:MAG TPA_asm: hypothetical protein [Caudoviricetes sp.]